MKQKLILILVSFISLLSIITFCLVATTSNIFSFDELPVSFVAVLFESVITAVITVVLLTGQSSAEEVKERNVDVFRKKSRIFEEYIMYIWEVLKDKKLEIQELEKLVNDYNTKIMIYMNEKSTKKMDSCFSNLADCITVINDDEPHLIHHILKKLEDKREGTVYEKVRRNLFDIVNLLSNELGLGGKINLESQRELEKKMLPALFRQHLVKELKEALKEYLVLEGGIAGNFDIDTHLYSFDKVDYWFLSEEGKNSEEHAENTGDEDRDPIFSVESDKDKFLEKIKQFATTNEDYFNYDFDYLTFRFKNLGAYEMVFIYISLSSLRMRLYVENTHPEVDQFRFPWETEDEDTVDSFWIALSDDDGETMDEGIKLGYRLPDNEESKKFSKQEQTVNIDGLNFVNYDFLSKYQEIYPEISSIIAKRASYWFRKKTIQEEDGGLLAISEFIEKYYRPNKSDFALRKQLARYLIETLEFERIRGEGGETIVKQISDTIFLSYELNTHALSLLDTEPVEESISKLKQMFNREEFDDGFFDGIYDNVWSHGRTINKLLIFPADFPGGIEAMKLFVAEKCNLLEERVKEIMS